ncbi:LysR family transcriptional regulator [Paracoccus zhejiangensis]|uniref:HTH-type transcriptional regulator CbbR n=1 Tax=Paracoccus zhejiangensis TaxID=1077935 RepID=A0A2H5EX37_9RHOB|nr:LysR family transcriptional regulator [Paracoccus zhejiangensis]AUH63868.1 LysR family transcriptional regulator [Paracoccus zhejiangensis]
MSQIAAITLKQLRALIAVAEQGSLTGAAGVLNQTTPAIHSQIRKLEEAVGQALLVRGGAADGFSLTAAGVAMERVARRIEGNLSQVGAEIAAMTRGYNGHVRLSVVSTGKYFAPRLVLSLRQQAPEVEVSLRVGNRQQVIADLDQGATDLAVMGRPPSEPKVVSVPLGAHPHGIILPPGHRLAATDGFDPAMLMEETFLARESGSGTRDLMMRYFDRLGEGIEPQLITMDSNETIKQAVMAGMGIALLSLHTCSEELQMGRLVALRGSGLPLMRQWYLVRPAAAKPDAATLRVAQAIEDLAGSYFPHLAG